MVTRARSIDHLERIGGVLCLDFINTIGWRGRPETHEWLQTYEDWVRWCQTSEVLTDADGAALLTEAGSQPERAAHALETAQTLRDALYRVFSAVAHGQAPPEPALDMINRMLPNAMDKLRLAVVEGVLQRQWRHESNALDWMLHPVLRSAVNLLTSDRVSRLKECANDGCGWLFLDTSRNRSRRWCDMRDCGNRVKARRHYQRIKRQDVS